MAATKKPDAITGSVSVYVSLLARSRERGSQCVPHPLMDF